MATDRGLSFAVPLVGQQVTIDAWFPTISLTCHCEATGRILLAGVGAIAACPQCQRRYAIGVLTYDLRKGVAHIEIANVMSVQDKAAS